MAIDLFGPDGSPRSVLSRPAEPASQEADSWFRDCVGGVPGTGTPIPARFMNRVKAQLSRLVRAAGIAENHADDFMISKAIQSGKLNYGADTGSADAIQVTLSVVPAAYGVGFPVLVKKGGAANATTTPSLNVNGLGAVTLVRSDGTALEAGELPAGCMFVAEHDGTNFRVIGQGPAPRVFYVSDGGSADAMSGAADGMRGWKAGQLFFVQKGAADSTSTTPTLNAGGFGPKTIVKSDGAALVAGDLPANKPFLVFYNGTNLRLLTSVASDFVASIATSKAPFNLQSFTNTTRVSATGNAGDATPVWSGINFVKKSATSKLVAIASFQSQHGTAPATYFRLSSGSISADGAMVTPGGAYTTNQTGPVELGTPGNTLPAGNNVLTLSLTNPGFNWSTIFNPVASDYAGYKPVTTATLLIMEVEP